MVAKPRQNWVMAPATACEEGRHVSLHAVAGPDRLVGRSQLEVWRLPPFPFRLVGLRHPLGQRGEISAIFTANVPVETWAFLLAGPPSLHRCKLSRRPVVDDLFHAGHEDDGDQRSVEVGWATANP